MPNTNQEITLMNNVEQPAKIISKPDFIALGDEYLKSSKSKYIGVTSFDFANGYEACWNELYPELIKFSNQYQHACRKLSEAVNRMSGLQSERDKAWNEAIEKAIETLFQADSNNILTELQKLKR